MLISIAGIYLFYSLRNSNPSINYESNFSGKNQAVLKTCLRYGLCIFYILYSCAQLFIIFMCPVFQYFHESSFSLFLCGQFSLFSRGQFFIIFMCVQTVRLGGGGRGINLRRTIIEYHKSDDPVQIMN